ncbi:MAG: glycosyltransferase family 4 protein, partial [Thermocrispum sp.]
MSLRKRVKDVARERLSPDTKRRIRKLERALLKQMGSTRYTRSARAQAAFEAGDYEESAGLLTASLEKSPKDANALGLASRVAMRRGAVSDSATFAGKRAMESGRPRDLLDARLIAGRLRETEEHWRPMVAAPNPEPWTGDRVVYLAKESRPFLHNGFCTRTHESLQSLVRAGRDVVGVTMPGFPSVIGIDNPSNESVVEDVVYRHLLPRGGKILSKLAFDEYIDLSTQALAGFVAKERPSLLHIGSGHRGFETALAGDAVARWAGIPWIYEVRSFFETTWTSDVRYMEQGEYYERRFTTETRMMKASNLVLTLSGPMRDEIADTHGIPAEKIRVIPNAVDLTRFAPEQRDQDLHTRLGLGSSFTIGYVSNVSHPREGQEVLVEAVALLRGHGREVTGLIVGDGSRREELGKLARKLGVADSVVFTGNVPFDQVSAYYAQIDLFVVPRVNERAARMVSPMKPFEAMAMEIPVMVADLPALVEIAGSGERAHTFRTGEPASLAAETAKLMDSPQELRRLTEAAGDWVRRERSWS